jgi:uncharacterized protein
MNLQSIFLDNLGNIRSGWRIIIFLVILFATSSIIFFKASLILDDLVFYSPLLLVLTVLIATVIMLLLFEKRPIHSVGLPAHRRLPLEIAQGILIGTAMISIIFLIYYTMGWIELEWRGLAGNELLRMLLLSMLLFTLAGFGEELFFRGYPFQTLVESIKAPAAVIIMSVAFGIAHFWNPNITPLALFNIILAGVWLSVAYLKTRTLWLPTGLHVSWNFFQHTIFSFPVSGQVMDDRTLFIMNESGPVLLTGGEFGPEGGLITTVVLMGGTYFIYISNKIRIGEGVWTVDRYIREQLEKLSK